MSSKPTKTFTGNELSVRWDGRLCIHVAECGKAEGDLFVAGRDPWCQPDSEQAADVIEICSRCPSGALSVHDASGGMVETAPTANQVQVVYNGPLYLRGNLDIDGSGDDMPGTRHRAALCRCGKSGNKPFCDNSHVEAGFEDAGAIGEKGPGCDAVDGILNVTPAANGPLIVSGGVELVTGSGRVAWRGDKVALCRCGASANKPFCDGSHAKVGFSDD